MAGSDGGLLTYVVARAEGRDANRDETGGL